MAELAGQHFGRERLEDSLIGDMDEEQVRMQRLKLIQMVRCLIYCQQQLRDLGMLTSLE